MRCNFDAIIIGGGPGGCTAALHLARAGTRVAILNKSSADAFRIGETIPPEASLLIADLGLLDTFLAQKHRRAQGIVSVWGSNEPRVADFLFSAKGNGWHLDRAAFEELLTAAAIDAGADYYADTAVDGCRLGGVWHILTAAGTTLTSAVLIDAAGRGSCGMPGLPKRVLQDHLVSIASLATPRTNASDYTLVEATEAGWFYSALLPNGKYVVMFTTDADLYAVAKSSNAGHLDGQLSNAPLTQERIGAFPNARKVISSASIRRTQTALPAWLATGDAAYSFDPLSGLGLVHALKSASKVAVAALDQLDSRLGATYQYDSSNREIFTEYLRTRAAYYSVESRWPRSPFWARRRVVSKTLGSERLH